MSPSTPDSAPARLHTEHGRIALYWEIPAKYLKTSRNCVLLIRRSGIAVNHRLLLGTLRAFNKAIGSSRCVRNSPSDHIALFIQRRTTFKHELQEFDFILGLQPQSALGDNYAISKATYHDLGEHKDNLLKVENINIQKAFEWVWNQRSRDCDDDNPRHLMRMQVFC
jgi:hypothetical protein